MVADSCGDWTGDYRSRSSARRFQAGCGAFLQRILGAQKDWQRETFGPTLKPPTAVGIGAFDEPGFQSVGGVRPMSRVWSCSHGFGTESHPRLVKRRRR